MQEGNKKEKWGKPKLIILTRGKPEEGALYSCKMVTVAGDPRNEVAMCVELVYGVPCRACADRLSS